MANTMRRGLFHALATFLFPFSSLFLPRTVFLACTASVASTLLLLEFLRLNFASVNRWFLLFFHPLVREKEVAAVAGSTYVPISTLGVFLLFHRDVAIAAMCFLAVGDPVSGIVGTRFGRSKLFDKSMEGNLACFLSCLVVGFALSCTALELSPLVVLMGAFSAALIQALPLPVNDNLTIPLFSALCMAVTRMLSGANGFWVFVFSP